MSEVYLEVTYRRGRALAAYLYLPRRLGQKSYRTRAVEPWLFVDYSRSGKPIGIEIAAPQRLSVAKLSRLLRQLGQPELKRAQLAPLRLANKAPPDAEDRA